MEKNYVVMTDSSADLNPALEQELGVDIIPLSVNCGDRTFLDYPDEREIKTSEFYGMLRSGANASDCRLGDRGTTKRSSRQCPAIWSRARTCCISASHPV